MAAGESLPASSTSGIAGAAPGVKPLPRFARRAGLPLPVALNLGDLVVGAAVLPGERRGLHGTCGVRDDLVAGVGVVTERVDLPVGGIARALRGRHLLVGVLQRR